MDKVSPNRQKKEKIVANLSEKVSRAKGLVFANYQGLTHVQLERLKKAIKNLNAELVVTKNTLLKLALGKVDKVESVEKVEKSPSTSTTSSTFSTLDGPTATLFMYDDVVSPLKALAKTIKELNLPTIKLGIIEGETLDSKQVLKFAALPSRDVLIAQLIFQMKTPLFGLYRALGWNVQKLVLTLRAIESKKV